MDSWAPKQLKCMQLGGNNGMSEFLSSYDLMSEPMDVRYQTKAAEYYRKKLRAFANDEEFNEEKPDYEEGRMPIEYKVKSQEELKDSNGIYSMGGSTNPNLEKAKDFIGEFWSGTRNLATKGYTAAGQGVSKVKESEFGEKFTTGAKNVGTKTAEYGGLAYNKTKEGLVSFATNEKVQEYSTKTINGAKDIGTSVWGFFSKAIGKDSAAGSGNNAAAGSSSANAGPSE